MKNFLKTFITILLSVIVSVGSVYLLQTNNIILDNPMITTYDTLTYVFDILDYNASGLFSEEYLVVSNEQIASVFTIYGDNNITTEYGLDWFEYDDDVAITFKKSNRDTDYQEYYIHNIAYIIYRMRDIYEYRDEMLSDYFTSEYITQPTLIEQETYIETLYETDYNLIFTQFEDEGVMGQYDIYANTISILDDLPIFLFSTTYAHELEHSRGILNEQLAQYNSFIKLWESNIPYLKYQVSLEVQYTIDGFYDYEYDCSILLFEYIMSKTEV